jgi:thiamine biosynthesis lipoprotein ApbE
LCNIFTIAVFSQSKHQKIERKAQRTTYLSLILMPKTGTSNLKLFSASIFAKECISFDANATSVVVLGLEKAKAFLKKQLELQAYLIYSD